VNWPLFIVQWIHVLLGVLWFGYALSMYFLISPTLMELPEQQGRITNSSLARVGGRVFPIVGLLVLALGILRGTVFGPINSLEDLFGTTYGWTWLVALVGTVALFYTGARYIGPIFESLKDVDDYPAAVARLRRVSGIDLGLFFVVFTCMILMRFGY
jgi:putative copper export protein